jgi:hypothetical protein
MAWTRSTSARANEAICAEWYASLSSAVIAPSTV